MRRLLLALGLALLCIGCSRGLAGTYIQKGPQGTLTLELGDHTFDLKNSNNAEVLSGTYTIKDNLLSLIIEEQSGKKLSGRDRIESPPLMIKDGGQTLEEEGGMQFRKQ